MTDTADSWDVGMTTFTLAVLMILALVLGLTRGCH